MRNIDTGLQSLVNAGDVTGHSAIEIYLKSGQNLYYSTEDVVVGAQAYLSNLRATGVVRHSRRRVIDGVDFEAQNIDRQLGLSFSATATALDGARAKFRKIYIAVDGAAYIRTLAQGVLATAQISELVVECKLIGDMNAAGALAAWRALPAHCQWRFKDPKTCGAVTAATLCTKKLTGPNSCETHGRRFRFSGFPFIDEETRRQQEDERDVTDLITIGDEFDNLSLRYRYSRHLNPYAQVELR